MQIHVGLTTLGFASQDIYFYPLKIFRLKHRWILSNVFFAVGIIKYRNEKLSGCKIRFVVVKFPLN